MLIPAEPWFNSCFPHVVNLSCKAVLSAITNMDYAANDAEDYAPNGLTPMTFIDAINRDPIATVRTLVRVVCGHHVSTI